MNGNMQTNFNYDVVYDDSMINNKKKVNINAFRMLIIIFLILFLLGSSVFLIVKNAKTNYKAIISLPDIVYMGESANVNAKIETNKNQEVTNVKTTFSPSNEYVFYIMNEEMIGSNVNNVVVPIQEGITDLTVNSFVDNECVASDTKYITVCPQFNENLLPSSIISVVKGIPFSLNIDFGEENCSKNVNYRIVDENIATISSDGNITGNKLGRTKLIISKGEKSITVPLEVTLKSIPATAIDTNINKIQLVSDENYRLKVKPIPLNATSFNYDFRSSNENVVTVSSSGLVKAIAPGEAIITVSKQYSNLSKMIFIVVNDMSIDPEPTKDIRVFSGPIKLKKGMSEKILINVIPNLAINKLTMWKSNNENVAVINSDGVVYAKNTGITSITVTNGSVTKNIQILVED